MTTQTLAQQAAQTAREVANYLNRGPVRAADVRGLRSLLGQLTDECDRVIEDAEFFESQQEN